MDFSLLKDFMDRMTSSICPGNSVSVCYQGKEVFTYQSGYRDVENRIPMDQEALFNIYSCSKITTVVAALQLYEKGSFLLDDPLYDFIPQYRHMAVRQKDGSLEEAGHPITLRHLFTHTAGLNYDLHQPCLEKARQLTKGRMDTLQVVQCLGESELLFEPGSAWSYSLSHDVLAGVVEVISGQKFRDYVKEHIFDPLEMEHSFYHNEKVRDQMAEQYMHVCDGGEDQEKVMHQRQESWYVPRDKIKPHGHLEHVGKNVDFIFGPEYDSGGAGITTSVGDYSRFCCALACGGRGRNGERILSPGTIELLRTNQLNERQLRYFNWPQFAGYGYGLGVRTLMDRAWAGSNGCLGEFGWAGAAGANDFIVPEQQFSVFFAQHVLNPHEEEYQARLRNVLYTCMER